MTNFEKHMEDLIRLVIENLDEILSFAIGVSGGKPYLCEHLHCNSCEFTHSQMACKDQAMRWLHKEVEK